MGGSSSLPGGGPNGRRCGMAVEGTCRAGNGVISEKTQPLVAFGKVYAIAQEVSCWIGGGEEGRRAADRTRGTCRGASRDGAAGI